jgi:uncharacterized membrane protein
MQYLESLIAPVSLVIELTGVAVIVVGATVSLALFVMGLRGGVHLSYIALRKHLARTILLGLEFLVAADIIRTVTIDHTLQNVAVLAVIVLIRTFLSVSLEMEVSGQWPWQRHERPTEATPPHRHV